MQKTASLLLLMMIFSFFNMCMIEAPSEKKDFRLTYIRFVEQTEADYRSSVEKQLYDSLTSKSSIKWIFTGLTDTQIRVESGGNQSAISSEGAVGVAQFMPSTWQALIDKKLIPEWFDINNETHQRIAQMVYIDYLYMMWWKMPEDRKALTIASYNAGPGTVFNIVKQYGVAWKDSLPKETVRYLTHFKSFV